MYAANFQYLIVTTADHAKMQTDVPQWHAFETVASSPENFKFPRGSEKFELANQGGLSM